MGGDGEDVLNGEAKVISKEGKDCTKEFLKGAYEALKIAKEVNAKKAIFKSKSPSCGCGKIYDGSLDRKSTRLNSSHANISYAVFCLKKKKHSTSSPICSLLALACYTILLIPARS